MALNNIPQEGSHAEVLKRPSAVEFFAWSPASVAGPDARATDVPQVSIELGFGLSNTFS